MSIKGFDISEPGQKLNDHYLPSKNFIEVLKSVSEYEQYAIIHQWMTEGIPYSFKSSPLLYEYMRAFLGKKLNTHPKELTLIGSARTGFSLAPSEFGREYSDNSDMDFNLISDEMFHKLANEFNDWHQKFSEGSVGPSNSREEFFWRENSKGVPNNIARGFIDYYKIPLRESYVNAKMIANSLWMLNEKLKVTKGAPKTKNISLRVYKDWWSAGKQFKINLSALTNKL